MASLALSACGYVPGAHSPEQSQNPMALQQRGNAVLRLRLPSVSTQYGVQSVTPYTRDSINHLVVQIFSLVNGTETPVLDGANNLVMIDLLNSELNNSITFSNLAFDATYRIRCFAYKGIGTAPEGLISTMDSSSYVDVTLNSASQANVTNLKVRLIDVIGTGDAAMGIDITNGGFTSGGPISISKGVATASSTPTPVSLLSIDSTFDWMMYEAVLNVIWNRDEDGTVDHYELELYQHESYNAEANPVPDAVQSVPVSGVPNHAYSFRWVDYSGMTPAGGHVRVYAVLNGVRSAVAFCNF